MYHSQTTTHEFHFVDRVLIGFETAFTLPPPAVKLSRQSQRQPFLVQHVSEQPNIIFFAPGPDPNQPKTQRQLASFGVLVTRPIPNRALLIMLQTSSVFLVQGSIGAH